MLFLLGYITYLSGDNNELGTSKLDPKMFSGPSVEGVRRFKRVTVDP